MLDVANQFGDGFTLRPANLPDRGVAGLYRRVLRPGMAEQDLLQGVADASVAAMPLRFHNGVRARRTTFLSTSLFSSSQEFQSSSSAATT